MNITQFLFYGVVVAFTFVAHEGAHWAMGEWLGYEMVLRANSAGLARGDYASDIHRYAVTAAGPAFTVLQGVVAYAAIRSFSLAAAFPFLLSAALMRALAAGVSLATPNDEMRLSLWLGLGAWTVFALVIGALLVLTVLAARQLRLSAGAVGSGVVLWVIFTAAVILGEPYLPVYKPN